MFEETSPNRIENRPLDTPEMCRELLEELSDMASWLAGEGVPPEAFRKTLVALEAKKMARFGLKLSSAVSQGPQEPLVHLSLRSLETGELCGSMNVNPRTGAFSVQYACA